MLAMLAGPRSGRAGAGAAWRWLRSGASILLATWLVAIAGSAWAQDVLPVPPLDGRVVDRSGTLTAAQRDALTSKLAALETKTGSQLVVLIVPTTQPEDIAQYAQRVGEQWKIGRRDVGDGLIVVVAKNDRRVRIEVAKALEGAVPDLAAKQIIDRAITPAFRQGDFAGGLNAAVDQLGQRIAGEGLPQPSAQPRGGNGDGGLSLETLAMFFFIGVPLLGAVLTAVMGRRLGSLVTGGAAGGIAWLITASVLLAAVAGFLALVLVGVLGIGAAGRRSGRGGFGGGPPIIWGGGGGGGWSGGGGGGGFSSGGGGDFGGGGSSGSW